MTGVRSSCCGLLKGHASASAFTLRSVPRGSEGRVPHSEDAAFVRSSYTPGGLRKIAMFNKHSRGPKPSIWTHAGKARFTHFFARRTKPLAAGETAQLPPLFEASAAAQKWLFTGFGDGEPTQVQASQDAPVHNVALGVTGAFTALGTGAAPGDGTCERYWVVDAVEVREGVPHAVSRVRGGTGDVKLRLPTVKSIWCSGHHCRPWKLSDGPLSDDEEPRPAQPAAAAPP